MLTNTHYFVLGVCRWRSSAEPILDARALYPDASLATLYDPDLMPPELRKAHQANDRAVMQAYGMPIKETDEAACVAWLMRLYQEKVGTARRRDPDLLDAQTE